MKLSIIIPIYNVEQYILECLKSVYSQELNDFEVICVDDKGTDKSIEIVKLFVSENNIDNLKIIVHTKNMGLSEARNTGIKCANGKYICFLDSDDFLVNGGIVQLLNSIDNDDLDIIEGNVIESIETNCQIELGGNYNKMETTEIMNGDDYFTRLCKKKQYIPMAWCRIFKTEFLREQNCYFTPNIKFEDEDFTPRAIISANRIKYLDIPFYVYRRRNGSITTNMFNNDKWYKSYLQIIKNLNTFCGQIIDKKSYKVLRIRIEQIALSIFKNPIIYGASSDQLNNIIKEIKAKKIYEIPIKSKNIFIKIQGILMKFPMLFLRAYRILRKENK